MAYIDSSAPNSSPFAGIEPRSAGEELLAEGAEGDDRQPRARRPDVVAELLDAVGDLNLARSYDTYVLDRLGMKVIEEFHLDDLSRKGWEQDTNDAMKYASQRTEPKTTPWPNASNVIFPLIGQASLQFGARTYGALIQNRNVVKGDVWGSDKGTPTLDEKKQPIMQPEPGPDGKPQPVWLIEPGEKRKRADRVGEYMSWQLLEQIPYWEEQTDQLLHQIPITGGAARKTYWDYAEDRPQSYFVSLMNLVWNKNAPSFEAAPRHSEKLWLYPHEIEELEELDKDERGEGAFLPIAYGAGAAPGPDNPTGFTENAEEGQGSQNDPDAPQLFIEQHCRYDLDDDGYAEPLIVTVHRQSSKVVRVVARYDEDGIKLRKKPNGRKTNELQRIEPLEFYTLLRFLPSLDGGSYPTGWGQLLRSLNESINTTLNQMFDAGTLQNSNTGFIASEMGMPSGDFSLAIGRWKRIATRGMSIKDSVFPMPFVGPAPTLFQLLGLLVAAGKEMAGIQEILTGEAAASTASPTTVLALIEQGLKVYTAITKRLFRGFKAEFTKLYDLNRKHLVEAKQAEYRHGDEWREITEEDFRLGGGVSPIADPTMTTDMQRLGRAQLLMSVADNPLVDPREVLHRFLEAANIERIDEIIPPPKPNPLGMMDAQFQIEMKHAELGRLRAAEQKDTTQAFLNLALARAKSTAQEEVQLNAQLDFLRLRIEAINAATRAADVDHKTHKANLEALGSHADRLLKAAGGGDSSTGGSGPQPTPAPTTPFPVAPGPAPVPGNQGAGVQSVAAPPDNGSLPAVPSGAG